MTISISLSAQNSSTKLLNTLVKSVGGQTINTEILSLTDVDLSLLKSLPNISDYNNLSVKLNKLPKEYIRCLESIDYHMIAKDTLFVRIYSQDYAYQSRNGYKIGINLKAPKAPMKLCFIYYDMKMKSDIADYLLYMNRQFEYSIFTKEIKKKEKIKRTIIKKKFTSDGSITKA